MPATGHAARVEFYLPRRHETIPKRRILVQTYGRRQSRFGLRRQAERDAAFSASSDTLMRPPSRPSAKAASGPPCARSPQRCRRGILETWSIVLVVGRQIVMDASWSLGNMAAMNQRWFPSLIVGALLGCGLAAAQEAEIVVHANQVTHRVSRYLTGACIEDVNHEIYGGLYSQMIFGESFQEPAPSSPLNKSEVSGMWRGFCRGSAQGGWSLETQDPFTGRQSQRMTFKEGNGEVGIENQSLNRWGMNFVKGKCYEGHLWLRTEHPVRLFLALESADGSKLYAETHVEVKRAKWQRIAFKLTPNTDRKSGRFAIALKEPGSVCLGYAFLQPGEWGRFKRLPVRKDVSEALVAQGLTVLRYGGSMVNHAEYRLKKMIGPPDHRPPYKGTWYPYSSNGWGIPDFLNFCEAAGFLGIPAVNIDRKS